MGRAWMSGSSSARGVWVALVWAASALAAALASPIDVQNLPVEHRQDSFDITSNLPAASNDMFIWTGPDGTYRFGMQGQDQWRVESRDAQGKVEGRYVYITPDGQTIDITYGAGAQGYRAQGDAIPGGAAPLHEDDSVQKAPYGALVRAGEKPQFPNGNGITTYTDTDVEAIVTDVKPEYSSDSAVFPILNIPGTDHALIGPALVNDIPIEAAAISI